MRNLSSTIDRLYDLSISNYIDPLSLPKSIWSSFGNPLPRNSRGVCAYVCVCVCAYVCVCACVCAPFAYRNCAPLTRPVPNIVRCLSKPID